MKENRFKALVKSARIPLFVALSAVTLYAVFDNFKAVTAAIGGFLSILTPVFLGIAVAFIANMPMRFLENTILKKWKTCTAKRVICLILSLLFIVGIIVAVFLLIIPVMAESVTALAEGFDGYARSLTHWASGLWDRVNLDPNIEARIREVSEKVLLYLEDMVTVIGNAALKATISVATFIFNIFLAFVIGFYALYNKEKLIFQIKKLVVAMFEEARAVYILDVCTRTNKALNDYFYGMIAECTILGLMTFIAMKIFDFPFAVLISVIVGVTQMVPIIGPWVSGAVGVVIIFVVDPPMALWFALTEFIVQQLEANLVYPYVVGKAVGLSGIWVMVAVLLGGGLFGIVGIILCVPVMAVLYTLVSEWTNRRVEQKRYRKGMRDTPPTEEEIKGMTD